MRFLYAALVARFMHGGSRAFCFVLCCSALSANAQWLPGHDYVLDRAGNVIHVRGPSITTPSYVVTGNPAGAVVVSKKAFDVAGHRVAIEAAKTIPWKNVATGVARAARITPYSMAAGFAVEWLVENGWRYKDCLENASTCDGPIQWERRIQDTSNPVGDTNLDYSGNNVAWFPTPGGAVEAHVKPGLISSSCNSTGTWYGVTYSTCPTPRDWYCLTSSCTMVRVDTRSAMSVAVGLPPYDSYADRPLYTRPKQLSDTDVWVNSPPPDFDAEPPNAPDPGKAPDIWDDALPGGIPDSAGKPSVTGPSSTPGPSSTTSGPAGTVTTTTVNNYNYQGDTITITESTVTTTTSPTGEVTIEETVSDKAPDKDDLDPCKQNPDALGCIKLGEVPDEEVTKVTRDVAVSAESVNLPAQCPAPIDAAGYSLSFDAACDFSEGVHPFVLAAAALMAGLIVIRSIQGA